MPNTMNVWRKGEGSFRVSSESQRGRYYEVKSEAGMWFCSCPHFQYRDFVAECKHISAVKESLRAGSFVDEELRTIQIQVLELLHRATQIQDRLMRIEGEAMPFPSGG